MFLFRLLKYVAYIADFSILILLVYTYKAARDWLKKSKWIFSDWIDKIGQELHSFAGNITPVLLIVSFIALFVTDPTIHQLVGISNLELNPEGIYCFYVEAISNNEQSHTLPAQIRIEEKIREIGKGENVIEKKYYIEKVVFPNGSYFSTDDSKAVEINKFTQLTDDNCNSWKIKLINKHAYSSEVNETNNATLFDITFLSLKLISTFFILYAFFKNKRTPTA